ncbi:MAG: diaminopimelate epimerase [Nocardioidaceae bacterium]
MTTPFRWLKGHGTQNDFVLLPDHEGSVHGELSSGLARDLCHRRRGIGADGVLRVVRSADCADPAAQQARRDGAEWFMDHRNADGSRSEMCGNGVRVFVRYLEREGLVDASTPLRIGTRDGTKTVRWCEDDRLSVDMGRVRKLGECTVGAGGRTWPAQRVDAGNPHAVAFVDSLDEVGPLLSAPTYDDALFPAGVNVEFAVRTGEHAVAMRVFERGAGETKSCGTGACAVALVAADDAVRPARLDVRPPGGKLTVTLRADGGADLAGPAVLVAEGRYLLG